MYTFIYIYTYVYVYTGQERKFFEEKAHIFKDLDRRKEVLREIALKEAKEAMGAEAKKILADNQRMFEELKFLHTMTADIEGININIYISTCLYKCIFIVVSTCVWTYICVYMYVTI
jgi:hypothetical protein